MRKALDPVAAQYDLSLLPWGGVAIQLHKSGSPTSTASPLLTAKSAAPLCSSVTGNVYVFLPLAVATGLPVHVNGFFEISENRRDIWYGTDMQGSGKVRSEWNVSLLEDIVAQSYLAVIKALVATVKTPAAAQELYQIFPTPGLAAPWCHVATATCRLLHTQPVVLVGDRAAAPQDVVFCASDNEAETQLTPLLLRLGIPICLAPTAVARAFEEAKCSISRMTPGLLRAKLRTIASQLRAATLSGDELGLVLRYVISDGCDAKALLGLPIIPLADDSQVGALCDPRRSLCGHCAVTVVRSCAVTAMSLCCYCVFIVFSLCCQCVVIVF